MEGVSTKQISCMFLSNITASRLNRTSSTQAGHRSMLRMAATCSHVPVYLPLLVLLIKSPPLVIIMQNLLSVFSKKDTLFVPVVMRTDRPQLSNEKKRCFFTV